MRLIYKHLLRATVGPFLFGFFVITFVLMIEVLHRYIDLFVGKGVPFLMATEVLALSLGHTFALSIPMAVLVSILMGVGQLAADHEITALKASGVGLYAILRPLLLGASVIALGLTAYNHFVFPESNHRLANLLYDINRKRPMMEIRPQMFIDLNERLTIHVRKKDDRAGRIEGVTIFERKEPGDPSPSLTTAEWGRVIAHHESDALTLELHNGETHDLPEPASSGKYQVIRFARHDILVRTVEPDYEDAHRTSRSDREMNLTALWTAAKGEQQQQSEILRKTDRLQADLLAYQWKLLDPFERRALIGARDAGQGPQNEAFRRAKFQSTRQKVELVANQAVYQDKIRDNIRAKENRYLVEFHKKFAIPFACLVFVLLGIPMAVGSARGGRGVAVSMALVVYLVYYLFLVGGEKLSDRGRLDPVLAMWMANILLTAVGIPIFIRTVHEATFLHITLRPPGRRKAEPPGPAT
jgi:lipopolysaccharide export system permease protein